MVRATTIALPGVFRIEEASNKAISRLQRANNIIRVSFVAADVGVIFQPGDVIAISNTHRGVDMSVFVESVVMVDYGRYRITGSTYQPLHYSDDFVTDTQYPLNQPDTTTSPWTFPDPAQPFFDEVWVGEPSCTLYHTQILAMNPVWYYPMNRQDDIDSYPLSNSASPQVYVKDYSTYGNDTYNSQSSWKAVAFDPPSGSTYQPCSDKLTLFQTATGGGSCTEVGLKCELNSGFCDTINAFPLSNEWTYIVHHPKGYADEGNLGEFRYKKNSNGQVHARAYLVMTTSTNMRWYAQADNWALTGNCDMDTNYPNWKNTTVGYRITWDGSLMKSELLVDFQRTGRYTTVTGEKGMLDSASAYGGATQSVTGLFSCVDLQESVLFNRALSEAELAQLKIYWDNNYG